MYHFLPQIIILACLFGIIVIIFRKFPVLAEIKEGVVAYPKKKLGVALKDKTRRFGYLARNFCLFIFQKLVGYTKKITQISKEAKMTQITQKQLKSLVSRKPGVMPILKEKMWARKLLEVPNLQREALSLVNGDQLLEAEKIYIEIIKRDPKNIEAYKNLGMIYLKQKNFGDAKAAFRQVVKLDPKNKEILLELKKLDEATERAEEK